MLKLTFFILALILFPTTQSLKCKNEKNEDVDWYFVYKIPKLESRSEPYSTGYAYVYITSNDYNGWQTSSLLINEKQSIFGQTLNQLYSTKKNQSSYILYSDQPPTGEATESYGHTKGIIAMDETTGFWLIHSVPKFGAPISGGEYKYPISGRENGQTALCFAFNTKSEAEKIVTQLLHNQPKVYDYFVSQSIEALVPNVAQLLSKKWIRNQKSEELIYGVSGHQFISFAKGGKVHEDLYDNFVAPSLESNLFVETWRRGAGTPLKSECQLRYHVLNVKTLNIKGLQWDYLEDHAKWAITESSDEKINKAYTCIGDINRMKSQFKRGGGTVCFNDMFVWKAFKEIVAQTEPCPRIDDESKQTKFDSLGEFVFEMLVIVGELILQLLSEVLM